MQLNEICIFIAQVITAVESALASKLIYEVTAELIVIGVGSMILFIYVFFLTTRKVTGREENDCRSEADA